MSITLTQLIAQCRQRSDMENSQFVTDAEFTTLINSSIAELHDLLVSSFGEEYSLTSATFPTISGTATYTLPNGTLYSNAPEFYKLRGVDIALSGTDYFTIKPFNFNERNRNTDSTWTPDGPNIRYRIVGSNIMFSPAPSGVYNVKLWYTPVATKLVSGTDILSDYNQYSEYVVTDVAIKAKEKEESDVTILSMQKQALTQRIVDMAQNRDAGTGDSVSDVYAENEDFYFSRS